MNKEEVSYSIMCKPTENVETCFSSLPVEIQDMMCKFGDIIVDDLPSELPSQRKMGNGECAPIIEL